MSRAAAHAARAATIIAGLALTSTLASCTDSGQPTVMPTPKIVWQDGITPTSPLEANPLVKLAREADIGMAMASNSGDFTIAQLTDNWDSRYIELLSRTYSMQGDTPIVYPGPDPWEPVRIVEAAPSTAVLEVCGALPGNGWAKGTIDDGGAFDRSTTRLRRIQFVIVDGTWKRTTEGTHPSQDFGPCDGSSTPVGYFHPAPELPKTPVTAPVRAPIPTDTDHSPSAH